MDVEQQGSGGVGVVADVAPGELEDEPGVDRPEDRVAGLGNVVQQPLDLGPGEVRVEHEAGPLPDQRLAAIALELIAAGGAYARLYRDWAAQAAA